MTGLEIAGIAGIGTGAIAGVYNAYMGHKNYDYQRSLQGDIFGREDNSIQRRVADLKAAGLSPVLAAGQGAGTGGIVSTQSPTMDVDKSIANLSLLKMDSDVSKTNAEADYIKMQSQKVTQDIKSSEALQKVAEANVKNINMDTANKYQAGRKLMIDANLSELTGTTGNSIYGNIVRDVMGNLNVAGKEATNVVKSAVGQFGNKFVPGAKERSNQPSGWYNSQFKKIGGKK